jgi:hypothetical protein
MDFDAIKYPRPYYDTGVGVHAGANAYYPLGENEGLFDSMLQDLRSMGITWIKFLDVDGTSYNACRVAFKWGMMPVVRVYRPKPNPGTLEPKQKSSIQLLRSLGVAYFERNNEPNLVEEWETWPTTWTTATFDKQAYDWYTDAQYIASLGGLTAIDALSPGGNYDDITYLINFLTSLKKIPNISTTFLKNHAWIAVHPAGLNHPINYPDDPINQKEHPGQTIHTHYYKDGTPTGASNCVRKWEAVGKIFYDMFGYIIPVMATEGSFWSGNKADSRYPELTQWSASDLNVELLKSMKSYPKWYMANMPWLLSNRLFGNKNEGFERDAWWRIPGWGNCPIYEMDKLPLCTILRSSPVQERGAMLEDRIAAKAQTVIIPLNPAAALEKAAKDIGDGRLPASPEFTLEDNGIVYVGQAFRKEEERDKQFIAYVKYNDWNNVRWIEKDN